MEPSIHNCVFDTLVSVLSVCGETFINILNETSILRQYFLL